MEHEDLNAEFVARRHELFSFIYALVRNVHDAEDIFQEVWLRFSSARERGIRIEKPAQWSRGTARNLILHHWRNERNAKVLANSELLDLVELAFAEHDHEEAQLWQARREALAVCVQGLPDKAKRLLLLRYGRGEPIVKVAEIVRRSQGSVMMALSRARRVLQLCVEARLKSSDYL